MCKHISFFRFFLFLLFSLLIILLVLINNKEVVLSHTCEKTISSNVWFCLYSCGFMVFYGFYGFYGFDFIAQTDSVL